MIIFSGLREYRHESSDASVTVDKKSSIEELAGKLASQNKEDKLMHAILEGDKDVIDEGRLIAESISQGLGAFTPELIFEQLVRDFRVAKKLYGETIIRQLTHYSANYVEKNISIPEFQREMRKNVDEEISALQKDGMLASDGTVSDQGLALAALVLYVDEIAHLIPKGMGEREYKKRSPYGDTHDVGPFHKTRYRDIALKQSIKVAIRRAHKKLTVADLRVYDRASKGKLSIIYAIDASGSMRGEKIKIAKKAGIALAFKAIQEKNSVGLILFGSDIKDAQAPTRDFMLLLKKLANVHAGMETDIALTVNKARELFPPRATKHLILLTDALPTKGERPEQAALDAVAAAAREHITISMIGINLDEQGEKLGRQIAELGNGRLYTVRNLDELDVLVLEEYERAKAG